MHPTIAKLASEIGAEFSPRCATDSWIYDGRTIALTYRTDRCRWKGPNENEWIRGVKKRFMDHDNMHELFHFLVASKEQRKLPEYGLVFGLFTYVGALGERDE